MAVTQVAGPEGVDAGRLVSSGAVAGAATIDAALVPRGGAPATEVTTTRSARRQPRHERGGHGPAARAPHRPRPRPNSSVSTATAASSSAVCTTPVGLCRLHSRSTGAPARPDAEAAASGRRRSLRCTTGPTRSVPPARPDGPVRRPSRRTVGRAQTSGIGAGRRSVGRSRRIRIPVVTSAHCTLCADQAPSPNSSATNSAIARASGCPLAGSPVSPVRIAAVRRPSPRVPAASSISAPTTGARPAVQLPLQRRVLAQVPGRRTSKGRVIAGPPARGRPVPDAGRHAAVPAPGARGCRPCRWR